jgi:hypothetical protein
MNRERIAGSSPARKATAPARAALTPDAAIRRLQRTAGNRAVCRILARQPDPAERATGWRGRATAGLLDAQLHLDPEIKDEMRLALSGVSIEQILERLAAQPQSLLPARVARPSGDPGPPPDPPDPPGFEQPAQTASMGMFLGAVKRAPEVKHALSNLEDQVWGRLSSGDQRTLMTTSITFGAAALGGVLATPGGRELLGHLSGVALPVPEVPWLSLEFSSRNDVIGLGVHVDVGALLPSRLGFGAAGPRDSDPSLYQPPR